ncbi:Glucosamine-6-phosphate isomerase (Glucosamine-6-phosphate deaminase) (GNPDA) (GlcN6P deaminase), partial [Oleoguttula sp. CCFEE 5521]
MSMLPVWPRPEQSTSGHRVVWISPHVPVLFSCANILQQEDHYGCAHAEWIGTLRTEFQLLMFAHPFNPEKLHASHEDFEPSLAVQKSFVVRIDFNIVECLQIDEPGSDEGYTLRLTSNDEGAHVGCTISSYKGGFYALHTLRQLFYKHSRVSGSIMYTPYAPFAIEDKPRFAHRGLNLDIARNRISPDDVLRTIDGMAATKLNMLHLHATDSQSWPLEIPALPELSRKGAYHTTQIWSSSDLENLQQYGKRKGVEVYLEIDMPGHTASIHHSFPELIVAFNRQPWHLYAAEPPAGQLKLNSEPVNAFLETLLNDVLPRVAKYTTYYHMGADEINAKAYELDPGVGSSSPNAIRPGLQALVDLIMGYVLEAGLTPIVWEELLLDWDIELPKSTIVQVWRSHERVSSVVQRGYRALFGPSTHWYLDGGQGGWVDPNPDSPNSSVKPPFLDWCDPYKNWRQICSYDPFEGVPSELQHMLLGGEVHLWTELTDSVTLDGKLWPRAAAAAQTL